MWQIILYVSAIHAIVHEVLCNKYVYVIAWVAVVFGINYASNAGRKLLIV